MNNTGFPEQLSCLITLLQGMESAVIAYSGGVDSTFLLKAAALAGIRIKAVTGISSTMPQQDLRDAQETTEVLGVPHTLIETAETERDDFSSNPPERCYYCKDELFSRLRKIADDEGYRYVLDGSNADDLNDWRPGRKAAEKHGIRSPLQETGLKKDDIRRFSRLLGLRTWDKPSSPCLSSRFPYGEPITGEALRMVASAEDYLKSLGFQELRVRHQGKTARIEVKTEEISRFMDAATRKCVTEYLRGIGYTFVTLDLEGFRSGRLNEVLSRPPNMS